MWLSICIYYSSPKHAALITVRYNPERCETRSIAGCGGAMLGYTFNNKTGRTPDDFLQTFLLFLANAAAVFGQHTWRSFVDAFFYYFFLQTHINLKYNLKRIINTKNCLYKQSSTSKSIKTFDELQLTISRKLYLTTFYYNIFSSLTNFSAFCTWAHLTIFRKCIFHCFVCRQTIINNK